MGDRLDEMLKDALAPSEVPDVMLNQKILHRAEGDLRMRKPLIKTIPVLAALGIAVLAAGSFTAYAGWKYLGTEQVAQNIRDSKLADAFKGEGAVRINDSQSYGGYKFTLLGMVSGKNLSQYAAEANGEILDDCSYTVLAIEKTDGSEMPKQVDMGSFLVSPFIRGEDPLRMNIYYMDGGASAFVENGVEYRLVECGNLESFAGRGVYLGVLDNTFYDKDAYHYDKKTGEITRNENYKGINALFNLPFDTSKADEEKAEAQLKKWKAEVESDDIKGEDEEEGENSDPLDGWTPERLKKEGAAVKGATVTYPASKFHELVATPDWEWNGMSGSGGSLVPDAFFKKNEYGSKIVGGAGDGKEQVFDLMERSKKDGSITISVYHN